MKKRFILFLLPLVLGLIVGCKHNPGITKKANEVIGDTYYTQANIWYEEATDILSTNYHRGVIIPAGTKVIIENFNSQEIEFRIKGELTVYKLVHVKKHSVLPINKFFSRYFAPNNINMLMFSHKERRNIEKGTLEKGMSKKAVATAYGYPPSHKTPSLDLNKWVYWESRFNQIEVYFKDGKVISING